MGSDDMVMNTLVAGMSSAVGTTQDAYILRRMEFEAVRQEETRTRAWTVREDAVNNTFGAKEVDVALTLQAQQASPQSHHAQLFITDAVAPRRLTPEECERLQGFPTGWTDGDGPLAQRYKQMGNAVAVPVVNWVVGGIVNG